MTNIVEGPAFRPDPLHLLIGQEDLTVASLDEAIGFIRSLRHDRLGRFAEMLLTQLESARLPQQKSDAWVAFATWTQACQLRNDAHHWSRAA
ncbi:hypothetical protein [Ancylobacter sp.]|uniref:hypothetical protein n=1 Tax=Ancylobacter sp. TaxID=1872567 RepID=UPI003BAADBD2